MLYIYIYIYIYSIFIFVYCYKCIMYCLRLDMLIHNEILVDLH